MSVWWIFDFSCTNSKSTQASDRISPQGRLVCHEGVPLKRLQFTAVGFSPTLPQGVCDKAAGVEKRICRNLCCLPALQSAGQDRPETARQQICLQRGSDGTRTQWNKSHSSGKSQTVCVVFSADRN